MSAGSAFSAVLALASCTHLALAADPRVPVAAPAEFRTLVTRSSVPVVFARSSGEAFNPIDKPAIEAVCEAARQTGLTDKYPVFEAGYGKPVKTESLRFSNATQRALLSTLHAYECVRPAGRPVGANGLCDCTFRVRPHYRAEIKNTLATGVETLTVDLTKGTAQRRVAASRPGADLQRDAERIVALAPEVVGRDVVAGIPCVIRRQPLGAQGYIERCIAEDPEHQLPPMLRYQALSESIPSEGGKSRFSWSRTDQVELNAAVDAGVFKLPDGVIVKETP